MNLQMKNGKVIIDGKTFTGSNVQINGNKVIVDGVTQSGELVGNISITVHGDVESIKTTNGTVTAGNVGSVETVNGSVHADKITGSVKTVNGSIGR